MAVHRRRATGFDTRVLHWLHSRVTGTAARVALDASTPAVSLVLLAIVLGLALRARLTRLAVVVVLVPALASGLTEWLLKPWVDRPYGTGTRTPVRVSLAFPSGHETLVAATAGVVLLALCRLGRARRDGGALVLTVWVLVAGIGLVVNFWHYATDVIGAVALAAAVTSIVALAADLLSSPAGRDLPRTTPAA